MSKQEIEIAIKVRSETEQLRDTIEAFGHLRLAIKSVRDPFKEASQSARDFDKRLDDLSTHRKDLKKLQESLKDVAGSMPRVGGKIGGGDAGKSAEDAVAGFFPKVETLLGHPAAKVGMFAGKLVIEGIAAGMERNAMMEDQVVAFTPLLKSAEAAKDRVAELSAFAATSPFDLPSVAQASRTLEQFGGATLSTGEGLRIVGDAAAATGQPIGEVSRYMGELYAGLKNGTPVQETTQRMVEMNLISADQANHLNSLAESGGATGRAYEVLGETFGRFGGTMKAQGETLGGMVHTLKETWLSDLGEMTSGLSKLAKASLKTALEVQGAVPTAAQQLTDDALNARRRADAPKSREDLDQQIKDAEAKSAEIAQSLESAKQALAELKYANFLALGPISGYAAYKFTESRLKKDIEDLGQAKLAYKGVQKALAKDGETNLAESLETQKRQEEEAARKKSEYAYGEQLKQNEAEQLQRLEVRRRQSLPLKEQADLARADLAKLEEEKKGLEALKDRPNEFKQRTLDLTEELIEGTARLRVLEQGVEAEQRKAADDRERSARAAEQNAKQAEENLKKAEEQAQRTKKAADEAAAAAQKARDEASRKSLNDDIQSADSNWRMTRLEKYNYKRSVMLRELDGPVSEKEYDEYVEKQGPDPSNVGDMYLSNMTELRGQTEMFATDFAKILTSPISGFQSAFGSALDQLLEKGATAGEFFGGIAKGIATSMRKAFTDMVTNWVTSHIVMKGVALAYDGFLKLLRWAGVLDENKAEAQKIAPKVANATLASIGSFGVAAAIGVAAIAGILASMGAFAEGGLTPGKPTLAWVGEEGPELVIPAPATARFSAEQRAMLLEGKLPVLPGEARREAQAPASVEESARRVTALIAFAQGGLTPGTRTLAWVGERGPELVLPADVTARFSPQQQAMLLDGRLPAVAMPGDGNTSADGSRAPRTVRQNHYHYWDRAQMIADSRDDISAIVHDVLRSRA